MSILTIDFNKLADNNLKNYQTINKNILLFEDILLIDNYYKDYDYIILKNNKLKKRDDFLLEDFVEKIVKSYSHIDIFILSCYGEKCQNLHAVSEYNDYTLYKSQIPGEIDALVFESNKWEKIKENLDKSKETKITKSFKNLIYNNVLEASFIWPQAYYSKNSLNMLKICREENIGLIEPKIKDISYFWFLTNLLFSILFLYILYDKIPRDRFYYVAKK